MKTASLAGLGLTEKIGQMLVVGFPGGAEGLSRLELAVERFAAGNVILFSRNVGTPRELFELNAGVRRLVSARSGIRPLVCLDQEGGVVARIRRGVTPLPGAMALAAAVAGGRPLSELRELGRIAGVELGALGFDWDLAPVADVNVNPDNPVIGVRSYGEDPRKVAELASAFAAGLADAGLMATAKHFPGHGDTSVDSHLGLPLVPHGMERLEAVELLPFRRLADEGVAAVMTAHVRFPAVEPEDLPATLSARVIQGLLRGRLGFTGLVCTDCMQMKAVAGRYPDAAALAAAAGADLVFVSHDLEAQEAAAESIAAAVRRGDLPESRIDEAVSRIAAAKARLREPPASWDEAASLLMAPASTALSESLYRASLTLVRPGEGLPPRPGALYVDVEAENLTGAEDGVARGGGRGTVSAALAGRMDSVSLPAEPSPADIDRALAAAAGRDLVVGVCNAAAHPAQVELVGRLDALRRSGGRRLGLVSMRSPYDIRLFPGLAGAAFLCAYEYGPDSARCVADYLASSLPAVGRCPVGADPRPSSCIPKEA